MFHRVLVKQTQKESATLSTPANPDSLIPKESLLGVQRKESAADSTASASVPKKIKLSVKLTAPRHDRPQLADQAPNQPPAESLRAVAGRPAPLDPPFAAQHDGAPEPRAAAARPEGSGKPHKAAGGRVRQSGPSRAAPNRPGQQGLPKVGCPLLVGSQDGGCMFHGCPNECIVPELQRVNHSFQSWCICAASAVRMMKQQ